MRSRLDRIRNWPRLAATAKYRVKVLAKLVGVSISQLERFSRERFGLTPHHWMALLRLSPSAQTEKVTSVKKMAAEAGYAHASHFSRDFKKLYGLPPRDAFAQHSGPMPNLGTKCGI